jgi:hypothetical protein
LIIERRDDIERNSPLRASAISSVVWQYCKGLSQWLKQRKLIIVELWKSGAFRLSIKTDRHLWPRSSRANLTRDSAQTKSQPRLLSARFARTAKENE